MYELPGLLSFRERGRAAGGKLGRMCRWWEVPGRCFQQRSGALSFVESENINVTLPAKMQQRPFPYNPRRLKMRFLLGVVMTTLALAAILPEAKAQVINGCVDGGGNLKVANPCPNGWTPLRWKALIDALGRRGARRRDSEPVSTPACRRRSPLRYADWGRRGAALLICDMVGVSLGSTHPTN